MHKDQSGAVLVLLIDKMISTNHAAISRMCDSVACRRVEVLLAEHEQVRQLNIPSELTFKGSFLSFFLMGSSFCIIYIYIYNWIVFLVSNPKMLL